MPATRRAAAPEGGPATLPPLPPPLPLPDLLRHWLIWLVALLRCLMPGAFVPMRPGAGSAPVVRLAGRELLRLPETLPREARALDASRNRVPALPRALPGWAALRSLNLGSNRLTHLPAAIGDLALLEDLNLASNQLTTLPPEIGRLRKLRSLGLRSNALTVLPSEIGDLAELEALYLTQNALTGLPRSVGRLRRLRKLQAASNRLEALPDELALLPELELLRVPCNALRSLPAALARHPTLTWLSLAGNPVCPPPPPCKAVPEAADADVRYDAARRAPLGAGASGGAFAAAWHGADVVVKRFVAGVSPDGAPEDEIAAACAVDTPRAVRVLGLQREPALAMLMAPAAGQPLGGRPGTAASPPLRCFYPRGRVFAAPAAAAAAAHTAAALAALHAARVAHGDVYAHNVLLLEAGLASEATLCDFGAAFGYDSQPLREAGIDFERLEARGFGLMLRDLSQRVASGAAGASASRADLAGVAAVDAAVAQALARAADACTQPHVAARPRFADVAAELEALVAAARGAPSGA